MARHGALWRRGVAAVVAGMALILVYAPAAGAADEPKAKGQGESETKSEPKPAANEGRPGPEAILDRLQSSLKEIPSLTDDQKSRIDKLITQAKEESTKAVTAASDPQERREKVMPVFMKLKTDLTEVFTDEQKPQAQEKWDAMMRSLRGAAGAAGAAGRGMAFFQALRENAAKLDLSAEQKEKLLKLQEDVQAKSEELRGKIQGQPTDEQREKIRTIMQETQQKLRDILTGEQMEKLRDAMQQGGGKDGKGAGKSAKE